MKYGQVLVVLLGLILSANGANILNAGTSDDSSAIGLNAGNFFLGGIDSLQANPGNQYSSCWISGNETRYEIFKLAKTFNPSLIANQFQIF